MRIVILGASRFGTAIAETLMEAQHEVVVIDRSRERLEALAERLDCGMLTGDGTMPSPLRERTMSPISADAVSGSSW